MDDPESGRASAASGAQEVPQAGEDTRNASAGKRKFRRKRPAPHGEKRADSARNPSGQDTSGGNPAESLPKAKRRRKRKRGRNFYVRAADDSQAATRSPNTRIGEAGQAPARPQAVEPAPRPHAPNLMRRRPGNGQPVYAALDLGTNNCRLLMAVPTRPGQFRVIDAFSRIVRLGEGLSSTGRLSDAAMDRAVDALRVCADKLKARQVRRARLIATEACRSAENGAAFLERVLSETGLELEIVDRETEARLAVSGCGSLVERDTPGAVLFDIGGGSSEIALIDIPERRSHHLAHHIVSWTSLPVGVVSLAERYGGRDVTAGVFDAMVDDVFAMIEAYEGRHSLAHLMGHDRFHLLGTSGTVTTLAGIFLELERYDRRRIDGIWMHSDDIASMTDRLLGWDFHQRVANPCIGADRADLVLAGCAILEAIRRAWPSERLRVADRGLREGILTELMAADRAWRRRRPRNRGERQ